MNEPEGELAHRLARLERRVERERAAREEAERIAERGMRDLWSTNRDLEVRVAERTAALEQALQAATKAADAKERFLGDLGHDLTSPLHAVMGLTELLDPSGLSNEDQLRLIEVRQQAGELAKLLNGLVDLANAEGATAPDELSDMRAADWLDAAVDAWSRPAALRAQLLVPSVVAANDPLRLDWQRLRRIFDALLANVAAHAVPGSVGIDLVADGGQVELCVGDSGPGIDSETLPMVREPFVSGGSAAGVGIGLTVASRLAVAGSGTLDIATSADGTTVTVRLPIDLDTSTL